MISRRCFAAAFAASALFLAASAASNELAAAGNSVTSSEDNSLKPCIDDSDCVKLGQGSKFACFRYICYPWQDDSEVASDQRRQTCSRKSDCEQGQTCHRHHDRRQVTRGLCFEDLDECEENSECPENMGCCGSYCCEEKYYSALNSLPCASHLGCRDLGLGQFCCPAKDNTTSPVCCNTDPNPPTTPKPRHSTSSAPLEALPLPRLFALLLASLHLLLSRAL